MSSLSEVKTTRKKRGKLRLNARKHWESESINRNLSAAVLHVKPSRHNSNLYDSRENHHKVEILNYSVSLQYSKRNRDFITINFQKFSFFQGVFHELERYIGFEPWDLFPLAIKCYRKWGCPGVPVHGGIPIVFISIHGVVTQFVNVSFLCVPAHEDTT